MLNYIIEHPFEISAILLGFIYEYLNGKKWRFCPTLRAIVTILWFVHAWFYISERQWATYIRSLLTIILLGRSQFLWWKRDIVGFKEKAKQIINDWFAYHIEQNPRIQAGKKIISGTRIMIEELEEKLSNELLKVYKEGQNRKN